MRTTSYMNMLAELDILSAHPGGTLLTKQMLNELRITPDMTILDAGCGLGETSRFISDKYGCQVNAIDSHPVMVHKAKTRLETEKNIIVQRGSLLNLPFEKDSCDHVICESVLSFTPTSKALQEIQRVLKDDGRLVINEMCLHQALSPAEEKKVLAFYALEKLHTKKDWQNLLKNSGFSTVTELSYKTAEEPSTEVLLPTNIAREQLDILDEHTDILKLMAGHVEAVLLMCGK